MMEDRYRKWVADKARGTNEPLLDSQWDLYSLQYMVQAMWAINREYKNNKNKYVIEDCTYFKKTFPYYIVYFDTGNGLLNGKIIYLHKNNNSEQDALDAALKYVYEQSKGGEE